MSPEIFISEQQKTVREIMRYFHDFLVNDLLLTSKIRFGIPFYYQKSWVCYLNPLKNNKVELAFLRGRELSNYQAVLDNKGRKQISGITFESLDENLIKISHEIIHEALILDKTIPYRIKRKK